jgi:mono/diheme cytochrome c family protein
MERPVMLGPDLTSVGRKESRAWIYKWLKEPRTLTDANGNTIVNGVETGEEPRMPKFRLSDLEIRALSAYLSVQRARPLEAVEFDPRLVAVWSERADLTDQGELRFRQMFCSTCHALAVTRAGETKLVGGDIGPELTKVGSKVKPEWLAAWLRDPQAYLPHSKMPRYGWSDEDLFVVTQYIQTKFTDPDLLSDVPPLGAPTEGEIKLGRRLFLEKGCASCHVVEGLAAQKAFGPDLSALGAKNVSQLDFETSTIPRNLISYMQAKITDPLSVNPAARMPQYHLTPDDLDAVTIALLSMTGTPANGGMEKLIVPKREPEFHAVGEFGEVYERYKCYVCHQFKGFGGTLAPDLSYEGSRANRKWLIHFLKNPQTLRPTLVLRMPQFNMSDREAEVIADYFGMVLQHDQVNPASVEQREFTPQMAALGKELYDVKYQCQACHTLGATGGYVGPSLSDAGDWLTPAWIEAWLSDPQALLPGTIEPRRAFTEGEVKALTAYLLTLRSAPGQRTQSTGAGGAQK